jgi:hypothetical protein
MVHRREIDGNPVVFGNQGDLWMNAMTWFDHDTGSIWSQPTGEAILGPLRGTSLELLPSTLSSWSDWKERFPETLALDADTRDTRFAIEMMAVVVVVGDDSIAIPFVDLRELGLLSTELSGEPILVIADPQLDRWAAYSRLVEGVKLDLQVVGAEIIDPASGVRWSAALGAPLNGQQPLDRVSSFSSFGSDYRNFYPDGELLGS